MTFKTTGKNEFKKDPLRGLEYNQQKEKQVPFVQFVLLMAAFLFIAVCFKMCFDEPQVMTIEQLNSDRR